MWFLLPILLLFLLASWRLNWAGRRSPWAVASGFDRLPAEDQPAHFSDDLSAVHPGLPMLHWLGHSGFRVEWGSTRLLLDPNHADRINVTRRCAEFPAPPAAWGRIDAAVISHSHHDHLEPATLRAVPGLDLVLLPDGSQEYLDGELPTSVNLTGLRLHEPVRVGEVDVIAVPAVHNGGRDHPWGSDKRAFGVVLRRGDVAVYYAGDTAFGNDFAGIRDRYHPVAAILPIGAFAPRMPLRIHHTSPEEAVEAARILGVAVAVPCHFGTFNMSLDFPRTALPRFAAAARAAGLRWAMPRFLANPTGETP